MADKILLTHEQWLEAAREDLRLGRTLLEEQDDFYPSICFHGQQAVEKALKAFLYFHHVDEEFRGHRLETLLTRCVAIDRAFNSFQESIAILDQYYVPTRYPDALPGMSPSGVYHATEAKEAMGYAEKILALVVKKIS